MPQRENGERVLLWIVVTFALMCMAFYAGVVVESVHQRPYRGAMSPYQKSEYYKKLKGHVWFKNGKPGVFFVTFQDGKGEYFLRKGKRVELDGK
jgi:hypothetical protein